MEGGESGRDYARLKAGHTPFQGPQSAPQHPSVLSGCRHCPRLHPAPKCRSRQVPPVPVECAMRLGAYNEETLHECTEAGQGVAHLRRGRVPLEPALPCRERGHQNEALQPTSGFVANLRVRTTKSVTTSTATATNAKLANTYGNHRLRRVWIEQKSCAP
eukprot:COSAG05_NODE_1122_length_5802_cov_3.431527_2_plen_160_part_00